MQITDVKVHTVEMSASWLSDGLIANPMSVYPRFKEKRQSWFGPMTAAIVEIQSDAGLRGLGTVGGGKGKLAPLIVEEQFKNLLVGQDPFRIELLWEQMFRASQFYGRKGAVIEVISGIDIALWDLKARLLELPLVRLFGQVRETIPIYGSGGFTNYKIDKLQEQLRGWVEQGILRVKMKIGRDARADRQRVATVRKTIGDDADLFVDANGAYSRKQALAQARSFQESKVSWFEEPVSSDDLEGLQFLRDRAPAGMDIAAGEYGYDLDYFRRMLDAGAIDVLQADATRCCGFTGFLQAATLCDAYHVPLSSHCAPSLHLPVACATPAFRHAEYFHDHVRIERMIFDGVADPIDGALRPDLTQPGLGLTRKRADVWKLAI